MKKIVLALAATLMAMTAQVAAAATSFSFSFSGPTTAGNPGTLSGSGVFAAEDGVVDADTGVLNYLITGASGSISFNGAVVATINGIASTTPPASNLIAQLGEDFALVDTVLGTSAGVFGLVLNVDADGNPTGTYTVSFTELANSADLADLAASGATLSVAAIPEPATWAMMLLGFAIIGATLRRRRTVLLAA